MEPSGAKALAYYGTAVTKEEANLRILNLFEQEHPGFKPVSFTTTQVKDADVKKVYRSQLESI